MELETRRGQIELHPLAERFFQLCYGTIVHDYACLETLPLGDVFVQERLTTDRHYFARAFDRLVAPYRDLKELDVRIEPSEAFLDRVFAVGAHNARANTKESSDEIFEK